MTKKEGILLFLAIVIAIAVPMIPSEPLTYERVDVITFNPSELGKPLEVKRLLPTNEVRAYLESKDSPLAPHTETLLEQEHWKLIIAISAIESTYCKRQLDNNCWGITDSSGAYKSYASFDEAIVDANGLITRWQARGKWLTVESMNCSYVVPCNPTWVSVVNTVLEKLESYEQGTGQVHTP